jgi:hypothetical protein
MRAFSLRCESRQNEQTISMIQASALRITGTGDDVRRISDALAATSELRRFILPPQRASYSLLSQVVALPAPGDAEDQK